MNNEERRYAERSASVLAKARQQHLDLGHEVLIVEDAKLFRVTPNGIRTLIKRVAAPRRFKPGTKIRLR